MGLMKLPKRDAAICAALALAAHYFPATDNDGKPLASFRHAAFLLSGQIDKWAVWCSLPQSEKQRIAAVLAFAPEDLAKGMTDILDNFSF